MLRQLLPALMLAVAALSGTLIAHAQDEAIGLIISVLDCETAPDPGVNPVTVCEPNDGAVLQVTGANGEHYGDCLMEPDVSPNGGVFSYCYVDVPFGAEVIITADETTLPPGYAPLVNPLTVTAPETVGDGQRGPDAEFLIIREGQDTQPIEPTVEGGPVTEPADEDGPVVPAPDSRPIVIHAGSCADLGEVVVTPGAAVAPSGPAVGQETAIPVLIGAATLDLSLDVLIDQDHAVAVLASTEPDAEIVACGDIGGVDDDDGALAIGLREVDGSGLAGIAYFAYNATDQTQTDISIFLADGLADDA
jgi:hypothetical protein